MRPSEHPTPGRALSWLAAYYRKPLADFTINATPDWSFIRTVPLYWRTEICFSTWEQGRYWARERRIVYARDYETAISALMDVLNRLGRP